MIYLAYSLATGRVFGWTRFTPQEDAQGFTRKPTPGLGILVVPDQSWGDLNVLQAYVTQQIGLTPTNDRYIAVDQKTHAIVAVLVGDPLSLGGVPGCDHYAHAQADPSWSFDSVRLTVTEPALTAQQIAALPLAKQQAYTVPLPQPVVKVIVQVGA